MDARKQVTHIDGKEIISREPAVIPHPHPRFAGKPVQHKNIEHILLEDGTETFMCSECGYTNDNGKAIPAHISGKHSLTRGPSLYSDDVLRTVIREVLRAKAAHIKGFTEEAARVLNEKGLPTAQGNPWTAGAVSHLWVAHKERLAPGLRPRRIITPAPVAEPNPSSTTPNVDEYPEHAVPNDEPLHPNPRIAKTMKTTRITRVHRMLQDLARELTFLDKEWDQLAQKAKAYDKLQDTLYSLRLPTSDE